MKFNRRLVPAFPRSQQDPQMVHTPKIPARSRYEHIDALRAVAVALVVVSHTNIGGIPGGSGVTIFFTISGFIITHLLIRERVRTAGFSIRAFYWRRFLKLAPPFLLIIAIPTFVYSFWNPISWQAFAAQVFFMFNWVQYLPISPVDILPGSSVVWSLAIEEQFYIGFALVWFFMVKNRAYLRILLMVAITCTVGALLLRIFYHLADVSSGRIYSGTDTRIDSIAIGILTAVLFHQIDQPWLSKFRSLAQHDSVPYLAATVFLVSLIVRDEFFRDTFRYSLQAVAVAGLILYGLTATHSTTRRGLGLLAGAKLVQIIGLSSYSMYLIHGPLMRLIDPFLAGYPEVIRLALLVVVGGGGGVLVWLLVERPVDRWKHRRQPLLALERQISGGSLR